MYRDEEGYYYLLDRKRDIIKTGGENVYAQEVEQDLLKNPAISECAVIGVPDRKYGEAIAAAIVLKNGLHARRAGVYKLLPGSNAVVQETEILGFHGPASEERRRQGAESKAQRTR